MQYSNKEIIDIKKLFDRHNPVYSKAELKAPLSLGNGQFCFTSDFTGLQTFFNSYDYFPICTFSEWGWHSYPDAKGNYEDLKLTPFDTYGREVGYPQMETAQEELYNSLRQNPHKFNLGVLGFDIPEEEMANCKSISQSLNLFEAKMDSSFSLWGESVRNESYVHSNEDTICFKLSSVLFKEGKLKLCLNFHYGSHKKNGSDFSMEMKKAHKSLPIEQDNKEIIDIYRVMDGEKYTVQVIMDRDVKYNFDGEHCFTFTSSSETFYMAFRFSPNDTFTEGSTARLFYENGRSITKGFWQHYWNKGGVIDLGESTVSEAKELERRIVLSQYLMAIQNRGHLPPAETALTCNSWYGKFHLEMHYWHSAHFPLWSRGEELEKSLKWYKKVLGEAKKLAASQGYEGARWMKMCGPGGDNSPSRIAVLLVWQQPHPILLAELCYRQNKNPDFLREYRELVLESAEFMKSFLHWDGKRYVLGPPVIPAQERFDPKTVINPAYEVEYFRWGLRQANVWLKRLGEKEREDFEEKAAKLATVSVNEGVYIAHENCPNTFTEKPFNTDHPSMLAMLGLLPGQGIDHKTMNATLDRVLKDWDLASSWGWDFPMLAMCAARLGRREDAVRFLLMDNAKNTYLPNGHNAQADKVDLPLYLPGNGGILLAAAMMAGGWDGNDLEAPGFPESYKVKYEKVLKYI